MDEVIVLSAQETQQKINNFPNMYRVVSISSPEFPVHLQKTGELLELHFDDVEEEDDFFSYKLATEEDCYLALEFLQKGGFRIIHCRAGISRSSAIFLGYLLTKENYKFAVDTLYQIRPYANPNRHILQIMCKILGKENIYNAIIQYAKYPEKQLSKYRTKYLQKQLNIAYDRVKAEENIKNLLHLVKMIYVTYRELKTGKINMAISLTRKILVLDPTYNEAVYWEAMGQELSGRYKHAAKKYQQYLDVCKYKNIKLARYAQQKIREYQDLLPHP